MSLTTSWSGDQRYFMLVWKLTDACSEEKTGDFVLTKSPVLGLRVAVDAVEVFEGAF